jgi:hypothetical protein
LNCLAVPMNSRRANSLVATTVGCGSMICKYRRI